MTAYDVYVDVKTVQIPKWQDLAKAAKAGLDEMVTEDAARNLSQNRVKIFHLNSVPRQQGNRGRENPNHCDHRAHYSYLSGANRYAQRFVSPRPSSFIAQRTITWPESGTRICPVMVRALSEHKKTTASATSCPFISRFSAVLPT